MSHQEPLGMYQFQQTEPQPNGRMHVTESEERPVGNGRSVTLEHKPGTVPQTTGVILAGGESRRMGSDKSLLPLDGKCFIERSYQVMASLFEEVLIVTNAPDLYANIPCLKVPDIYYGKGALAGIHSGLHHASQPQIFVVACDMPFLQPALIRYLCAENRQSDVQIPRNDSGLEPLHSCYNKTCLPAIEALLKNNGRRIIDFFPAVRVTEVGADSWQKYDAEGRSFHNINTPKDYFALRDSIQTRSKMRQDSSPEMHEYRLNRS